MRRLSTIVILAVVVLAAALAVAIAQGASHLVTTALVIPLGAILGFSIVAFVTRDKSAAIADLPAVRQSNVVDLYAHRRAPAPQALLPAPRTGRLAA